MLLRAAFSNLRAFKPLHFMLCHFLQFLLHFSLNTFDFSLNNFIYFLYFTMLWWRSTSRSANSSVAGADIESVDVGVGLWRRYHDSLPSWGAHFVQGAKLRGNNSNFPFFAFFKFFNYFLIYFLSILMLKCCSYA